MQEFELTQLRRHYEAQLAFAAEKAHEEASRQRLLRDDLEECKRQLRRARAGTESDAKTAQLQREFASEVATFLIRRRTPFPPYVAPRFPHMS